MNRRNEARTSLNFYSKEYKRKLIYHDPARSPMSKLEDRPPNKFIRATSVQRKKFSSIGDASDSKGRQRKATKDTVA